MPVLPGGFAIMAAIFSELKVQSMKVANGAMRQGILYDMMGRFHHRDMRDTTVAQFTKRYHVDAAQAQTPVVPPGGLNFVDARDAAGALVTDLGPKDFAVYDDGEAQDAEHS